MCAYGYCDLQERQAVAAAIFQLSLGGGDWSDQDYRQITSVSPEY